MKNILLLCLVSINSITAISAQDPYDVFVKTDDYSFYKSKALEFQKTREKLGQCKYYKTFEFKEGDRFIFEKNELAIESGWDFHNYYLTKEFKKDQTKRTKLLQRDFAGKIIQIIKKEEVIDRYFVSVLVTFEVEGSKEKISLEVPMSETEQKKKLEESVFYEQVYTFPDLIYLPEIDNFREVVIGKTFYTTENLVIGRKYQPVKIVNLGAGSQNAPIRIVYEKANGTQGYKDVCTCGSNLYASEINRNYFENFFTMSDPRSSFKGTDEIWDLITRRVIKIGMSEQELMLSYGKPKRINETINGDGNSKQYVYSNQYVYIENGIIVSIQKYNE